MLIIFVTAIHLGFEGGINYPIIGLDYQVSNGTLFKIYFGKEDLNHNVHLNLMLGGVIFEGKNPGYSFNIYNVSLMLKKSNWRITPFLEGGIDYITRELNKNREWGIGFDYMFGILFNFYYENINIYPALYFNGLTDFKTNAGCLGIKLGIRYGL